MASSLRHTPLSRFSDRGFVRNQLKVEVGQMRLAQNTPPPAKPQSRLRGGIGAVNPIAQARARNLRKTYTR